MKKLFTLTVFLIMSATASQAVDTYVAKPGDYTPPNPAVGTAVTWNGASGPVSGLVFGSNAFTSIIDASNAAGTNDTVYIASGTYNEGAAIPLASTSRNYVGDGPGLTIIDGNLAHSVFIFLNGTIASVQDLTIQRGRNATGGGVLNLGDTLTLKNIHFDNNTTTGGGVGGGALMHDNNTTGAKILIKDCLFSNNTAPTNTGSAIYQNGGIISITNSTVANNTNIAVYTTSNGLLQIVQSTFYGNTTEAILIDSGSVILRNSILLDDYTALNTTSNGANFIGEGPITAGDFSYSNTTANVPADVINTALQNNGGASATFALTFGSPAIDAGISADAKDDNNVALAFDQRGAGFPRIVGAMVDIGAVEFTTLLVTTNFDEDDGTTDPNTGNGTTLREAIAKANQSPGTDIIQFSDGSGGTTNFFDGGNPKTIRLTLGELFIDTNVDIMGPGEPNLTISGDSDDSGSSNAGDTRILDLGTYSVTENPKVTIQGITFDRGSAPANQDGGAILNSSAELTLKRCRFTNCTAQNGGAIHNEVEVTAVACTFDNNGAVANGGAINFFAPGITFGSASEQIYLIESTFSNNTANNGGAVHVGQPTAFADVVNCTFSANNAANGGAFHVDGGDVRLVQVTIAANKTTNTGGGGGIYIVIPTGGFVDLKNSIVAGNESIAGTAAPNEFGGNLNDLSARNTLVADSGSAGSITDGGDGNIVGFGGSGTRPFSSVLKPLSDNGGPTLTHALASGSPAIDGGNDSYALTRFEQLIEFDQRGSGFTRFINSSVDMGAFESLPDTTPPLVTLIGNDPIFIECGIDTFSDPGATALDNFDGDISGDIVVGGDSVDDTTPGTYTVTYDVTDASGNSAIQISRSVVVQDTTAPVVSLLGDNPQFIPFGQSYVESGSTAADACEGDVTGLISIDAGNVNENLSGSYTVTYDVTDTEGNVASQLIRAVIISEADPILDPVGNKSTDELVELTFTTTASIPGSATASPVFSLDGAPSAATINPATGVFSWTPGEADGGNDFVFDVVVVRDDDLLLEDRETVTVTVNDTNEQPTLDPITDKTVAEATQLTVTVTATDTDLPVDNLTFTLDATAVSLGMAIDPVSGIFSWTPTIIQGPGFYSATITVSDNPDPELTDSVTFNIDVTGNLEATTTTLTTATNAYYFDDLVTFTVNVASLTPVGADPEGTVNLNVGIGKNAFELSDAALINGVATFTNIDISPYSGSVTFSADYSGDGIFEASSDSIAVQIRPYRYAITGVTQNEDESEFIFDITRSLAPGFTGTTTLDFFISDIESSPDDFTGATSGTLSFVATETARAISIFVDPDDQFETDESFDLILDESEFFLGSAQGTILNDDELRVSLAAGAPRHEPDSYTNSPPAIPLIPDFYLSRNGTFGELTVTLQIEPTSLAAFGSDYTFNFLTFSGAPLTATVTISDGNSEIFINTNVINDTAAETDETINLSILPNAAYKIDNTSAPLTIAQNDFGVTSLTDFDPLTFPNGGEGTIRQAIINQKASLTTFGTPASAAITFAPGLTGNLNLTHGPLMLDTASFDIEGPGAQILTINGGGTKRIFVANDPTAERTFQISGLRLNDGFTDNNGGAILNLENLTLQDCLITDSRANNGGGISNEGTLTLNRCVIAGNNAILYGGGLENFAGMVALTDTTIENNAADFGGGIENSGSGTLQINAGTIARNIAFLSGGGVDSYSATTLISNSTISTNDAGFGAGVFNEQSNVVILQSSIIDNYAIESVGGILNSNNAPAATTQMHNSIVAGNLEGAGFASDVFSANPSFVDLDPTSSFNLIGNADSSGGLSDGVNGNIVAINGVGVLPLSAIAGPLSDNGGLTQTHALAPGSLAIDAGNNIFALTTIGDPLTFDQRGTSFLRISGLTVDIGAYERTIEGFAITNFTHNGAQATITWSSEVGQSYDILRSTDLQTWTVIQLSLPSFGSQTIWTDPAPPAGNVYYIIRKTP
jgi:hypothetical protein